MRAAQWIVAPIASLPRATRTFVDPASAGPVDLVDVDLAQGHVVVAGADRANLIGEAMSVQGPISIAAVRDMTWRRDAGRHACILRVLERHRERIR